MPHRGKLNVPIFFASSVQSFTANFTSIRLCTFNTRGGHLLYAHCIINHSLTKHLDASSSDYRSSQWNDQNFSRLELSVSMA